jgi:hypothetical protein
MIKVVKNGKKMLEIKDNGDLIILDAKLSGLGDVQEDVKEKEDGTTSEE